MQDVPGWPIAGGVSAPSAVVTVNNRERKVLAYSVRASVGTSAVSARTGEITWAPETAVSREQRTVLTSGVPSRGDRVVVDAGPGAAKARIFTGKVDVSSSAVPGPLESDLMDDWDMLSAQVNIPPLMATMHPDVDEGPLREIGLTATWPMQRALAQAGFRATPDGWPGGVLTASLNGSLWPEVGELMSSVTRPTFVPAPWGDGARGYAATYQPGARSFAQGDLQITLLVGAAGTSGSSLISCNWGGSLIQVVVDADRTVRGRISTGTPTTVLSLSPAQMASAEHVVLRVSSAGVWRLVAGNGASATATTSIPSSMLGVPTSWIITASATSPVVGGVNTGFASTSGLPVFKRTAVLSASTGTLEASRAIVDTPAETVLSDRAQAEGARMWIDANGVFQWRSYSAWGAGAPVRKIDDVDLLGYRLGTDYNSLYSGVTVKHLGPIVDVRSFSTITLFQGSRQVLSTGNRENTLIEVPAAEDWPAVDWSVDVLGLTGSIPAFNRGKRSWTGGVRVTDDGATEVWAHLDGYASFTVEPLDLRRWLHTVQVSSALPATDTIETRSVLREGMNTAMWPQWSEYPLPVLRGYARVTWLDRTTYGSTATTMILPSLQHDCSWWVQGGAVQRLADHLAQKHSSPVVTIKGLQTKPDQRIEIGDVLELSDRTYAGLSARVVVTEVNIAGAPGEATQTLGVEVLSATATQRTYAQVQASAGDRTYAQFQALIGAVTYAQDGEAA